MITISLLAVRLLRVQNNKPYIIVFLLDSTTIVVAPAIDIEHLYYIDTERVPSLLYFSIIYVIIKP